MSLWYGSHSGQMCTSAKNTYIILTSLCRREVIGKKTTMPTAFRSEEDDPLSSVGTDVHVQEILLAASQHDLPTLRQLIESYTFPDCEPIDVQDPETGYSPLHAAIAACDVDDDTGQEGDQDNGRAIDGAADPAVSESTNGLSPQEELIGGSRATIQCLLENGAIWNQLDVNNDTPGCIALRLGLKDLYGLMVDAGVRAELLLNRLEGYEQLEDEEDEDGGITTQPDAVVEVIAPPEDNGTVESAQYLAAALSHSGDKLLDEQQNGVMMAWESDLMKGSADALLTTPGLRILNIGFGMGIIDGFIQNHTNKPASHHIIEAHPSVITDMRKKGWFEKSDVTVHEGRWQDILPGLVAENQVFDAIYFDTFAEDYAQFREFFSEHVIGLLDPGGRWSFFNGMGADRQISYDVYQKVVEMDLLESGFDVEWQGIDIPKLDKEWEGVKRKYWNVDKYRLPVCKFMD